MTRLSSITVVLVGLIAASAALAQEEVGPKVRKRIGPSVAFLNSLEGFGSGIALDDTGMVLTNAHVMASALPYQLRIDVVHPDGRIAPMIFKKVKYEKVHPILDLALVSVDAKAAGVKLIPAVLSTETPEPGQRVYAMGNPGGGDGGRALMKTFTSGDLSETQVLEGIPYWQHSATINSGNSGGPLCNSKGEVIGVNTLKSQKEGIGFAIGLEKFNRSVFVAPKDRPRDENKSKELMAKIARVKDEINKRRGTSDQQEMGYLKYVLLQLYSYALLGDPGNKSLYVEIGELRYLFGHHVVAAAYLARGIELDPWYKQSAYIILGQSLARMGKVDMARLCFIEGIAKFPADSDLPVVGLAKSFEKDKQYADAAYYSQLAIAVGVIPRLEDELKAVYEKSLKQLTDADADVVRKRCEKVKEEYAGMQAAAKTAKAKNQSFLNPDFEKFVRTFDPMENKAEEMAKNLWGDDAGKTPEPTKPTVTAPEKPQPPADPAAAAKEIKDGIASAQTQYRGKEKDKAIESLKSLIARYPDQPETKKAKDLLAIWEKPVPATPALDPTAKAISRKIDLAKLLKKSKQDDKAAATLKEVIEEYPAHPDTKQARDLLAQWGK